MFRTFPILLMMMTHPALAAKAEALGFRPSAASEVRFEAVGRPSLLKIKGHGAKLQGELRIENQLASGAFEIRLDELDTGIDLRNRHMKENYLKTGEFPKATLELEPIPLPADWTPGKDLSAPFKGRLTLKGKTKPVSGELKIQGPELATEAAFTIQLSDFDVGVPKYMGITVADTVNASVKIPAFERK